MSSIKIRAIVLVPLFSALIAVGAFVKIPLPYTVVTLQTFFVILSGQILGGKKAFAAVLIYILTGLSGVPIFAGGGGVFYVFNSTFGFLIGFLFAAYFVGKMFELRGKINILFCFFVSLAGMLILYAFGLAHFYLISHLYTHTYISVPKLFAAVFFPTFPKDVLTCAVLPYLFSKIKKIMP